MRESEIYSQKDVLVLSLSYLFNEILLLFASFFAPANDLGRRDVTHVLGDQLEIENILNRKG
jgi:hypothetical protein